MLVILLFLLGGREKPDVVPFISKPEHTSGSSENAWHACWVLWGIHPKLKQPWSRPVFHFVHLRNTASLMLTPSIRNWT